MLLTMTTADKWDETLWLKMEPVYKQAFPHGAKPRNIIKQMIDKQMAVLHAAWSSGELEAMAVTGVVGGARMPLLLIDYLAVRAADRDKGIGTQFLRQIGEWAVETYGIQGILIEAEAGGTEEDQARIRFWQKQGFLLTSYIHQYVWVPEPYRAMLLPLSSGAKQAAQDGEALFRYITAFHEKAYRRR